MIAAVDSGANAIFHEAKRLNDVRDQVKALVAHAEDLPNTGKVRSTGKALAARLDSMSIDLVQPKHTNGQDIINFHNGVVDQWIYLASNMDGSYMPVTQGTKQRLSDLQAQWPAVQARIDALLGAQVQAFNALLEGKAAVIVPTPGGKPVPKAVS
jgi:acetoin utilization deacetylase AcuC-like enzyme